MNEQVKCAKLTVSLRTYEQVKYASLSEQVKCARLAVSLRKYEQVKCAGR